jgi:two-component system cell cycle response regulator
MLVKHITVLTVEDDQTHAYAIRKMLESSAYTVLMARTGADALSVAKKEQPTIILMDMLLPDLDGCQVCRKLKSTPETRHIPVVIYSSVESPSSEAHESGASAFLTYPVNASHLKQVIEGTLEKAAKDRAREK